MHIKNIEFFLDCIKSEEKHNNGVDFTIHFNLYHGQNASFMKYIKNKIVSRKTSFKKYIKKSKNKVIFAIRLLNMDDLEILRWYELFSNCVNKTYLIMLSNSNEYWLYNTFLEIFLDIDVYEYSKVFYCNILLELLKKQEKETKC